MGLSRRKFTKEFKIAALRQLDARFDHSSRPVV